MSLEISAILQKTLLENEKVRKRQLTAFLVLLLATLGSLIWIAYLAGEPSTDVRELLVWAVIAIVIAICYGAIAVALYINRTALRLLRTLKGICEQV